MKLSATQNSSLGKQGSEGKSAINLFLTEVCLLNFVVMYAATKNKKRTFKSSLKPFGMMKTKSESNLAQRFDFVAVDIPLDNEPVAEKTNEQVISNEPDKLIKQEETINSNQKGRRPSVFEESLKEFYGETIAKEKGDLPSSEITLEDLDAISGQTTE